MDLSENSQNWLIILKKLKMKCELNWAIPENLSQLPHVESTEGILTIQMNERITC